MKEPAFLAPLKNIDPEFYPMVSAVFNKAMDKGALDLKTKALICLALDSVAHASAGVKQLAQLARAVGAKDEEIAETVRLAFLVGGLGGLTTGLSAFEK